MKFVPAGFALTFIFALTVSCGADRGDQLSSDTNQFGGRLTQGTGRANLTVTEGTTPYFSIPGTELRSSVKNRPHRIKNVVV